MAIFIWLLYLLFIRICVRRWEGVVLLQPARPQVRDGAAHQPRHALRLLEGHRQGPRRRCRRRGCGGGGGDAQDAGVLPGPSAQGEEDGVGDARVPPPSTRRAVATSCGNEGNNLDLQTHTAAHIIYLGLV